MYYSPRILSTTSAAATGQASKHLLETFLSTHRGVALSTLPRTKSILHHEIHRSCSSHRGFHTTPHHYFKEILIETGTESIRTTKPAWPHPIYTEEQMNSIVVAHREAKTWSDWVALGAVRTLRWGLDLATGYRHDNEVAKGRKAPGAAEQPFAMTERKYLIR